MIDIVFSIVIAFLILFEVNIAWKQEKIILSQKGLLTLYKKSTSTVKNVFHTLVWGLTWKQAETKLKVG